MSQTNETHLKRSNSWRKIARDILFREALAREERARKWLRVRSTAHRS
jgi:hypothetical protein